MNWTEKWISPETVTTTVRLQVEALGGGDALHGPFISGGIPLSFLIEVPAVTLAAGSAPASRTSFFIHILRLNSISNGEQKKDASRLDIWKMLPSRTLFC